MGIKKMDMRSVTMKVKMGKISDERDGQSNKIC